MHPLFYPEYYGNSKESKGYAAADCGRCLLAENATVLGDVRIGKDSSIWYGAILRGDVGSITIGERSNIQDGVVIHATQGESVTIIGNDVSVGHNAVVHGAKIGNDVLIGMGAVVMDNAIVPDDTVVAAGAVVLANSVLEPGIYAGVPAKKVKAGSDQITKMIHENAGHYQTYTTWYE